jgi:WD40 repeat protein
VVYAEEASCASMSVNEYCLLYVHNGAYSLRGLAFSPDNNLIVTSSPSGNATVISYQTRAVVEVIPISMAYSVAFSPDGQVLALGGDDEIVLWSISERRILARLFGQEGAMFSMSFSPDGQYLASGAEGTIAFWQMPSGELVETYEENSLGFANSVDNLVFSANSKYLASSSAQGIRVWRFNDAIPLLFPRLGFQQSVDAMDFSPDGEWFAFGGIGLDAEVWHVDEWRFYSRFKIEPENSSGTKGTRTLTFTTDSNSIVVGEYQNPQYMAGIQIFDVEGHGPQRTLLGSGDHVYAIERSSDGQYIVGIATMMMGATGRDSVVLWRLN